MPFPLYQSDYVFTEGMNAGDPIAFTSQQEIETLLSYKGVILHLDDLKEPTPPDENPNYLEGTSEFATDENAIVEIVQRVTSKIMEYLAPRFEAIAIYQLPRIREIATYWACHDLSRRRGNEPLYESEVAEGIETLERYREGSLYLNAVSSGPRAYTQTYITDSRFYRNPTRVLRAASTQTVPGQKLAWDYPFFWL